MEYYRRAAAYGSTDALCHLGLIFELGDGEIAPDRLRAREYYKQAETRLMVVQAATMDTEEGSIGSESSFEKEPEKPKPRVILKEIKHLIHLGSNRENFFTYSSTFQGAQLVNALIESGHAMTRYAATTIAQSLLTESLISSVSQRTRFHDNTCVYRFGPSPTASPFAGRAIHRQTPLLLNLIRLFLRRRPSANRRARRNRRRRLNKRLEGKIRDRFSKAEIELVRRKTFWGKQYCTIDEGYWSRAEAMYRRQLRVSVIGAYGAVPYCIKNSAYQTMGCAPKGIAYQTLPVRV
ncbi:hypothetical protein AAMO2058_000558100 [Amorphochlora amoebiformis]